MLKLFCVRKINSLVHQLPVVRRIFSGLIVYGFIKDAAAELLFELHHFFALVHTHEVFCFENCWTHNFFNVGDMLIFLKFSCWTHDFVLGHFIWANSLAFVNQLIAVYI